MQKLTFILSFCSVSFLLSCASTGPTDDEAQEAHAYAQISQSHFGDRKYAESLVAIERSLALDPENTSYLMSKGIIFYKMDHLDDAVSWVSSACSKREIFPECWNNLAIVFNAQHKYSQALKWSDKALTVPTYTTPELAYVNKAESLLGMKRNYEAKNVLKKALVNLPQDCGLRVHLVRAQVRDRAFEDALTLIDNTLKICTKSATPLLWEAYTFYKIGNSPKSRYSLEKVLRYYPKTSFEEWARGAIEKLEQKVPLEEPTVILDKKGV